MQGKPTSGAVLDSAAGKLWRFFPNYQIEPIVVTRGHSGPITLFRRNGRGEIVVCLDTEKTYWSQYSYQFAHELCHILCGFKEGYEGNKWFEETVCETASLYRYAGDVAELEDVAAVCQLEGLPRRAAGLRRRRRPLARQGLRDLRHGPARFLSDAQGDAGEEALFEGTERGDGDGSSCTSSSSSPSDGRRSAG